MTLAQKIEVCNEMLAELDGEARALLHRAAQIREIRDDLAARQAEQDRARAEALSS